MKFIIFCFVLVSFHLLFSTPANLNVESTEDSSSNLVQHSSVNETDINKNESNQNKTIKILEAFILNPLSTAVLAAIITLIITNLYNKHKRKIEHKNNYRCLLITSQNEINFYKDKLIQLSNETHEIIESIQTNNPVAIPTYSLYPRFLEEIKFKLIDYSIDSDVIKEVSNCHFELSHIDERLDQLKTELRTHYVPEIQIANVRGFHDLLNTDIHVFEETSATIQRNKEK